MLEGIANTPSLSKPGVGLIRVHQRQFLETLD
jgi:hypothetical protein